MKCSAAYGEKSSPWVALKIYRPTFFSIQAWILGLDPRIHA
jgi:hypothetical protein